MAGTDPHTSTPNGYVYPLQIPGNHLANYTYQSDIIYAKDYRDGRLLASLKLNFSEQAIGGSSHKWKLWGGTQKQSAIAATYRGFHLHVLLRS